VEEREKELKKAADAAKARRQAERAAEIELLLEQTE
jgi:hypothetical protein